MKISELIEKLEATRAEHGDLPVGVEIDDYIHPADGVLVEEARITFELEPGTIVARVA